MKKLLPCASCGIDTVHAIISGNRAVCWCGCEQKYPRPQTYADLRETEEAREERMEG